MIGPIDHEEVLKQLDDALVSKIEDADKKIKTLKEIVKAAQEKLSFTECKLSGLNNIDRRYAENDFKSHRSYFDSDLDIDMLLTGYIAGTCSEDKFWSSLEENQHFKRETSYNSHSSSSRFGSFGGGGFSSGRGFGGGGFSSGKGF